MINILDNLSMIGQLHDNNPTQDITLPRIYHDDEYACYRETRLVDGSTQLVSQRKSSLTIAVPNRLRLTLGLASRYAVVGPYKFHFQNVRVTNASVVIGVFTVHGREKIAPTRDTNCSDDFQDLFVIFSIRTTPASTDVIIEIEET